MPATRIESLKTKAKLLQKAKSKAGKPTRLKDAFELIAKTAGFASWRDLKAVLDANESFCPPGHSALWKVWYASYAEALEHIETSGGYLLPYQKEFFVCDADYIRFLGVTPDDEDLKKVGSNWAEPCDAKAFERLMKKIAPRK